MVENDRGWIGVKLRYELNINEILKFCKRRCINKCVMDN